MGIEEVAKSCASLVEKEKDNKQKEKLFVHVMNGDVGGFKYSEFYTIDMRNGQVSECPYVLLANHGRNSVASLGSVVYVVGGLKPEHIRIQTKPPHTQCTKKGIYHKFISYLDLTNDTGDGWKQGPCLSEGPSTNPAVVAFGGKIYLFHRGCKSKTAEVFDPIINKWETLLPPPGVGSFDIGYVTSAVVDSQNNRILVHFKSIQSVYAYYPADNQWELVLKPFNWSSRLVFADGVIFVYLPENPEFIFAYDVATKQCLNNVFTSELSDRVWRYEFDAMIYLGNGLMCLAAYSSAYSPPQTRVYLIKFRFKRSTQNPADLLITMLPEETYNIGTCATVHEFFPV